jgi:putative nucleotidyltransferase-like protein
MAARILQDHLALCASWPERFPPEQWRLYKKVMEIARRRGVRFAVGGGLASTAYAGQWRNTKDIDLYILKRDREPMLGAIEEAGLRDYYEQKPYDRKWIYRSYRDDTIVDVIWAMANQRALVDEDWLDGPEIEIEGESVRLLAPEEMVWSKLYIVQRERCDWPDALNLLYMIGPELDWSWLLKRVGPDTDLLGGLLSVFGWLSPGRARQLPSHVWAETGARLPAANSDPEITSQRANLVDSRPWLSSIGTSR